MRAAVYDRYGPPEVLRVAEIEPPTLADGHTDRVLIQVKAASVNPFDVFHRAGFLPIRPSHGWLKPKTPVLGIDVAGTVTAVGAAVTRFKIGDAVFGNCFGSHAEVVRARVTALAPLPQGLTFADAAALPTAALTALQGLRTVAAVKPGQRVLVNGASGGVGHLAVQIAKALGAHVTAVCSGANVAWVQALGPDRVIDYTREDFTRAGERYDLVYDAVGKRTYFACKPVLAETGVYITENPLKTWSMIPQLILSAAIGDKRPRMHLAEANEADMAEIADLCAQAKLRPVIDRSYRLDQIAEAHRHVERGHTKGKVVIDVTA